jgi:hypothetical protein
VEELVGVFTVDTSGAVLIPLSLNNLVGKDNKSYFEMGAGVRPVIGTGDGGSDFSSTFGHLSVGYRRQPEKSVFLFRAFIVPVFGNGFFVPYYSEVAFGYKF